MPVANGGLERVALERLRRFGGEKLVRELVELFLAHGPARAAAARTASAKDDARAVRSHLHALKSSAAQLGAAGVQRLCEAGESYAGAGRLERVPALLDAIDAELTSILGQLAASVRVP